MQNVERFDNFKLDILNEQLCDSLTAYTVKVGRDTCEEGLHIKMYFHLRFNLCSSSLKNGAVIIFRALPKGTFRVVTEGKS